ncbi:phage tail protein [Escherichia coli]|nr:phage tail protein [Escherichia coli]MCY6545676.1 phage tail protein [Escherichia coli]MCY6550325.1 phage tail protein [Escherichia coli]HDV4961608.1 tail fiber protein [Escherichia coli]
MLRIGQVEATATQDGKYTDGSVAGGIAATRLRAAAFNAMQEELAHIVESAGLALDINDMTQVLKAIQKLTLSRANPFADIKSDGAAAISTALTNLGLGEGSALPVGVPVPWPSATPPTGWLKCNGAPFTASEYPKLAQAYPSLKLPDLRGEFIRGWDDGRGIDASRSIMSQQQGSLMSISVSANTNDDRITVIHVYNPPRDYDALISGVGMDSMAGYHKAFDISSLASTLSTPDLTSPLGMTIAGQFAVGGVSRPRNVAFNYIVRAA